MYYPRLRISSPQTLALIIDSVNIFHNINERSANFTAQNTHKYGDFFHKNRRIIWE